MCNNLIHNRYSHKMPFAHLSTDAVKTNHHQATDLRMNDDYVFYYVNLARFIVTLVVPFLSLMYLNTNIYL